MYLNDHGEQGSPSPGPQTGSGPWTVRNRAAQQGVSGGRVSEASSVFTVIPHRWRYRLPPELRLLSDR